MKLCITNRQNGTKRMERMNSKNANGNLFMTFFKAYPIIYKPVWKENLVLSFVDIFHGMSYAVIIILTQQFFDLITKYFTGNVEQNVIIKTAVLLISCQILTQILNGFVNFYAEVVQEKGYGKICAMIQEKITKIAPIEFEKNHFLDAVNKAEQGAQQACAMVDIVNSVFTFYVPYFGLMSIYMYQLNYVLVFAVLLIFIPVFIMNYMRLYFSDSIETETAPLRREAEAYEKSLTSLEYYKETRVLSAAKYFVRLYKNSVCIWNQVAWKKKKKEAAINIILSILSFGAYGIILIELIYLCMKGEISVGSFAAVFSSIDLMFFLMDEIFQDSLGNVAKNMGLVNNFLNLIKHQEVAQKSIRIKDNRIQLKHVTFWYPDSEKKVLDDISLDIKGNELIAIVGENGAGKTSLAKIILGLYWPEQGEVFIGGEKIDSERNAFSDISAVFQNFKRYKLNLEENITISDFANMEAYTEAMKKIEIDMNIDSNVILSRDFDGIDLSGGQWQKIAIARGIHKNASIFLLDEPTAAIDPVYESEVYHNFMKISQNKTSIIITHRLGLAKIADRIVVMKNGKIVEDGNHQELIDKEGEYYRMWIAQAKWYKS